MTDFPTVYVERPFRKVIGNTLAGAASRLCYRYCGSLYRRFDAVCALGEHGGAVCTSSNCRNVLEWALEGGAAQGGARGRKIC